MRKYSYVVTYTARSVIRQYKPNPALWLATRAGKMALSCSCGITCCVPQGNSVVFYIYIKNPTPYWPSLFTQDGWKLAPYLCVRVYGPLSASRSIGTGKELIQYPAILTSHLVNDLYIFISLFQLFRLWELWSLGNNRRQYQRKPTECLLSVSNAQL